MKKLTLSAYISPLRSSSCDMDMVPWVKEMYPDSMTKNRPQWFKELKPNDLTTDVPTLKFCPSFVNFMRHGFVVKNQADVTVSKKKDGIHLHTALSTFSQHLDTHSVDQFGENFPFPEGFLQASVKFLSPFNFRPNKSVSLFILPCWWAPESRYIQAMHGLCNMPQDFDFNLHINTFIKMPEENQVIEIPAGVPLAHLFFVDLLDVDTKYEQGLADTSQAKRSIMEPNYRNTRRMADRPIDRIKRFLFER